MSKAVNPSISLLLIVLVFSLTALSTQTEVYKSVQNQKAKEFGNRVCTNKECAIVAANFIHHGNEKIEPCNDFAQFACDRYQLFKNSVPLHETEHATNRRLELLLEAPTSPDDKPYHTLMKTFYHKCLNNEVETTDDFDSEFWFNEIGGWPLLQPQTWTKFDTSFEEYIANIQKKHNAPILFNAEVLVNYYPGNTDENMLYLAPATAIQMAPMLLLELAVSLGADHSSLIADINDLYSKIDSKRQKLLDLQKKSYIKYGPLGAMKNLFPNFDLEKYVRHLFDGIAEVNSETTIAITNFKYFQKIHTLFTDKRIFANYAVSALLSKIFFSQQSCIFATRRLFKYPIGQLYVKNHFDHTSAVPKVAEMIKLMKEELHEIIEKADWLDDTTQSNAFKKLDHLKADIGYPENLFDDAFVSDVYNIPPSQPSENYLTLFTRIQRRLHEVQLSIIGEKLDRVTWKGISSIVMANAMNIPHLNKIHIPAGILTLPHFSPNLPDYINYGTIGQVVAHEIMHGYDNEGRLYDETGDFQDWWKEETADVFQNKSECLVKQYDKENYDGQLSLGENIADNGGMKLAFNAYKKLMASRGDVPEPALPGFEEFTPESMFFMAFANNWCNAGKRNSDDEHPPGETRSKVVSQNMKEFSKTFACPKKATMNPDERCSVW